MSSCASSFPEVKLYMSYPRSQVVHQLFQKWSCTSTVPEVTLYPNCPWGQMSQRSGYASTVPKVKLCLNCHWSHCPRGQAIHPPSLGPSCTSTVPEVKPNIHCPWGQAVHPVSQRSSQNLLSLGPSCTSTIPKVKPNIHCPWGQAVHSVSQRSGCTSTVPGAKLYIHCPRGQAVHPLSQRSSCASTVPEVKLCIHSPHPLFPWMAGVQQNWWRLLCSLLSASWLDSRNQTENVTVMHSSPKLKQGCCSPLAANEKNFPVAKVCFVVIVVCFKGLGVSKKIYKKMNICPKKTIQGIHWSGTKNKTISFPTVESTKLIGPTNKQGSQLVPENHHTLRHWQWHKFFFGAAYELWHSDWLNCLGWLAAQNHLWLCMHSKHTDWYNCGTLTLTSLSDATYVTLFVVQITLSIAYLAHFALTT